jgi:hypothetical protein
MLCSDAVIWGWLIHSTQCLLSSYISTQTPFVATLHCSLKTSLPIDQQLSVPLQFCWAWAQQEQERGQHASTTSIRMSHAPAAPSTCCWMHCNNGLGIDLSVAASACDPGQFCMQQHARSIAFMHASWLVQSPCLSFSNCGTHTHRN